MRPRPHSLRTERGLCDAVAGLGLPDRAVAAEWEGLMREMLAVDLVAVAESYEGEPRRGSVRGSTKLGPWRMQRNVVSGRIE